MLPTIRNKVMSGGTPANPAALANGEKPRRPVSLPFMSLAHHLVEEGGGCGRGVEARNMALHRQAHAHITSLPDQPVNALALAADDEANGLRHVELPGQSLATRV